MGGIFFALLFYLYHCILYRHHFRALIALLVAIPFITVLFTGNLFVFFSAGMVPKIGILLLLELLPVVTTKDEPSGEILTKYDLSSTTA